MARWYDRFVETHTREITGLAVALLGDVAGVPVLDVGTGTGNLAFTLAAAGARVTAVDLSPSLLAVARGKNKDAGIELLPMDATALSFPDRSFGFACASMLMHELPTPARDLALAELARVSARGVLVIDYRTGLSLHPLTRLVEWLEMSAQRSYVSYPLEQRLRELGLAPAGRAAAGQFEALLACRT